MQLLVASTVTLPNILPIVHVHLFHKVHNIKTQGNHNDFTNVVVHILLTPVNCALFCWKIRVHNISIYAHCNFKNLDFSMIYEIIIDLVHILLL